MCRGRFVSTRVPVRDCKEALHFEPDREAEWYRMGSLRLGNGCIKSEKRARQQAFASIFGHRWTAGSPVLYVFADCIMEISVSPRAARMTMG